MCATLNQFRDGLSRPCRRRSADVGGLLLATGNNGQGQGWIGYHGELHTRFAELLSDMYTQTLNAVNEHGSDFVPTTLPGETRYRLINSLDRWHFEPHKLPDEEALSCTLLLFETLFRIEGMREAIRISLTQITAFVHHLRQIYRWENSYHNFEHALDVLQASHSYLRSAGMVPPVSILLEPDRMWKLEKVYDSGPLITCLGLHDLFVIYIAAIGHDVGHPGFSNHFMKNAGTPLSVVFDGKSALEQMHCHLLLRVMRYHGLGSLLDSPADGVHVRRLLWDTVLATDMSVHDQFMENFKSIIDREIGTVCRRQVIICQAILKCADISNPSRPYPVSQHWASALMNEWTSQALLEKFLDLPATVQPSHDPLIEATSQVFFISTFAKPLLDLTVQAIPGMEKYARQCTSNLERWKSRCEELQFENSQGTQSIPQPPSSSLRPPDDYLSAFPLTLPPHRPQADDLVWPASYPRSSDSSCGSSESTPCSPCESVSSFPNSPLSEASNSIHRPPSSSSSRSSGNNPSHGHYLAVPKDNHAAIRAAGKLGIRKQRSINRNSWCASPSSLSYASTATGQPRSTVALLVSAKTILAPVKPDDTIRVKGPIKVETHGLAKP